MQEGCDDMEQAGKSFPSRSIPKLKTPTDGSELRMWHGKEAMQVVSGTSQEAYKGKGSAELVPSDHSMWREGNQRLIFH